MNLVAHGTEMSDIVMGALDFCQCSPGSMPGLDAILGWGLFQVRKGVFQVLWALLTIKVLDLISSDLRRFVATSFARTFVLKFFLLSSYIHPCY